MNGWPSWTEPDLGGVPVTLECPRCGLRRKADPADLTGDDDEAVCLYCVRDAQAATRKEREAAIPVAQGEMAWN